MKRYSGRLFSDNDLDIIRQIIADNSTKPRRWLSKQICEALNWRNPVGELKAMRCRAVMLEMQRDGLIQLLPVAKAFPSANAIITHSSATEPEDVIILPVDKLNPLTLRLVKPKTSKLWNEYIDRYHYLGYKKLPGNQLRYFVYSGDVIVALLGFGAAAWKTAPRDKAIGWTPQQREHNLHLLVNNARFLILPWVQSKNLASKLLSLVAKQLPQDWQKRYKYKPVLFETFVEIPRFTGGCYKAANWIHVGTTTGRGRNDRYSKNKLPKKDIWLYPLDKQFKQKLRHMTTEA